MTIQTTFELAALAEAAAAPDYEDSRSHYWTPWAQRRFLEKLAESGSVQFAAAEAGKSRRAAYSLRFRTAGKAFKLGWEAALLVARATLADDIMERSINGQTSIVIRDDLDRVAGRSHKDNRLAMSMLTRLDRQCDTPVSGSDHALAGIIAQDFEAFLDLVSSGGAGSEAALFVQARMPADESEKPAESCAHGRCELCGHEELDEQPEEPLELGLSSDHPSYSYAKDCSVWWDDESQDYRTDFPPPEDFDGPEQHHFGHEDYERALTPEEWAIEDENGRRNMLEMTAHADFARKLWFKLATPSDAVTEILAPTGERTAPLAATPLAELGEGQGPDAADEE